MAGRVSLEMVVPPMIEKERLLSAYAPFLSGHLFPRCFFCGERSSALRCIFEKEMVCC